MPEVVSQVGLKRIIQFIFQVGLFVRKVRSIIQFLSRILGFFLQVDLFLEYFLQVLQQFFFRCEIVVIGIQRQPDLPKGLDGLVLMSHG